MSDQEKKWEEEANELFPENKYPYGDTRFHLVKGYLTACRKRQEEIDQWREFAWLHHGCSISVLYGDDGEMQCNVISVHKPIDFKRDSLQEIIDKLHPDQATMNKLIKEYLEKEASRIYGRSLIRFGFGQTWQNWMGDYSFKAEAWSLAIASTRELSMTED